MHDKGLLRSLVHHPDEIEQPVAIGVCCFFKISPASRLLARLTHHLRLQIAQTVFKEKDVQLLNSGETRLLFAVVFSSG